MPISQMRNGLTAGNSIFSQKPQVNVGRSKFDLSRLNCFTSDIGMIVPVDLIPTLPGDDFKLSCQYKIDFRPLLVPTLTAYKVKIHYYYCPMSYLWQGFESFISKGRSGNLAMTIPYFKRNYNGMTCTGLTDTDLTSVSSFYPFAQHSLYDYLIGSIPYYNNDSSSQYLPFLANTASPAITQTGRYIGDFNLLPFLMYQKIYRSNYMDPNLMSNGIVSSDCWFPDDIDSTNWRFNDAASNLFNGCYFTPINVDAPNVSDIRANFVPRPTPVGSTYTNLGDNCVNLLQLRYCMYTDDMFTTALPFLQRGSTPTIGFDVSGLTADLDMDAISIGTPAANLRFVDSPYINPRTLETDTMYHTVTGSDSNLKNYLTYNVDQSSMDWTPPGGSMSTGPQYSLLRPFNVNGEPIYWLDMASFTPTGSVKMNGSAGVNLTAAALRSLLALSIWQERNALTNGSYGQFIKVHFDTEPRNSYCEPIYIGGTTSIFDVNSILQTSTPSTAESGNTPLGNPAGLGSSGDDGYIGNFRANDFGYIMAVMMIIPDNVYTSTHEHWEFDLTPDSFYMPEYEKLSYQPILNKQLAVSGSEETDNGLFGYSNRYVYLKQRDSVARGMFGAPASVDAYYHSYVQARDFKSTAPALSQQFVTVYPPNIDRSFLAYPGQPAFLCQYYSKVEAVRPLSYISHPNDFGF